MNTASTSHAGGLSLVETVLALSVVVILSLVVTTSLTSFSRLHEMREGQSHALEVTDRVLRHLEFDASYAVRVFTGDREGRDYMAAMAIDPDSMMPGSRLPRLTTRGYFEEDGPPRKETGNVVFLGCSGDELILQGASDRIRIESFLFVVYHIAGRKDKRLDLRKWTSTPVASLTDLEGLPNEDLIVVLTALHGAGVRFAWNPQLPRSEGLMRISESGALEPLPSTATVSADDERCVESLVLDQRIQVAANDGGGPIQVPLYARSLRRTGFPGGFEVKVDGNAASKLMLLRLVLCSKKAGSARYAAENTRLINCGG